MVDTKILHQPVEVPSEAGPALPRSQSGSSPQHLLVTLLGDLWYGRSEAIPASVLIAMLAEFDISKPAARAAINRLIRRGLLDSTREGREARYVLTERAHEILRRGLADISESVAETTAWDGRWTLAAFSIAEERRGVRSSLRNRLRWLGMAPLFDALWVSSHAQTTQVVNVFHDLEIKTFSVIRGELDDQSGSRPADAWDIEQIGAQYGAFQERYATQLIQLREGRFVLADALVARTRLMDEWRTFLALDPKLPAEVLPMDWPRTAARRTFASLYDGLGDLALLRARQIVSEHDDGLAERLNLHTMSAGRAEHRAQD